MDALALLDVAVEAAHRAGALLLERFAAPATGIETKTSPTDVVSDADRASERLLMDLLASERPDDGVVGEEGARRPSRSGVRWVVDPLDGTVNYLYGIPAWCVSIAAEDDDGGVAGVVFDPSRDETFAAARGHGARLNGTEVRVSERTELSAALVATGFGYDAGLRAAQGQVVARVLPRVRDVRRGGSAALDLVSVACGRVDAFYEAHMNPWDRAAGQLVVREAGGVVTELRDPTGVSDGVVAGPRALHDRLRVLVDP
ncbi:MAG TPA: inositol monophosphatase family protein [Actinomycetota bacterium]|nr:inositol monophosphatase family protein [Actinomycetota bacterium]